MIDRLLSVGPRIPPILRGVITGSVYRLMSNSADDAVIIGRGPGVNGREPNPEHRKVKQLYWVCQSETLLI